MLNDKKCRYTINVPYHFCAILLCEFSYLSCSLDAKERVIDGLVILTDTNIVWFRTSWITYITYITYITTELVNCLPLETDDTLLCHQKSAYPCSNRKIKLSNSSEAFVNGWINVDTDIVTTISRRQNNS